MTFINRRSCDVVEHKSCVNIIDVLEQLKKVNVLINTDALQQ